MEIAIDELQNTIEIAEKYLRHPKKTAPFVSFHIKALQEDIELLSGIESPLVELQQKALDVRIQARRLKRRLEVQLLELQSQSAPAPTETITLVTEQKAKGLKLPPLKLPTFSGDGTKFLEYWNVLFENVINNTAMTSTAKWMHLRDSLAGAPAELISEIPQTAEMLNVALKLLDEIYGGEEKTITELYNKFHNLPTAANDTPSVRMTHAKLEGILLSLTQLRHEANENQYIRSVYIGKFPSSIINEVVKTKNTPLQEIRDSIAQLLLARESTATQTITVITPAVTVAPTATAASNAKLPTAPRTRPQNAEAPLEPPKCLFCTVRHWPDQCQTYAAL